MKFTRTLLIFALVSAFAARGGAEPPKAHIDGTADGFHALGKDDFVNVNCHEDTWTFKPNGVTHCTGKPVGVIRSAKPYKNFELVVEWRHLKPKGNSGIFVWSPMESLERLKGPGLPHGIEVQVLDTAYGQPNPADWYTSHGDVFPVGSSKMKPFPPLSPNGSRSFPSKETTKDSPEWNHYYIRAINGEVRLWVNGEEVSGGNECRPSEGYLCLESEGSPIEFRGLRIRELPDPPSRPLPELKVGESVSLFDGETLHGWVTESGEPVTEGWTVAEGTIHRATRGGNIYYAQDVGDFELSFQWKIPAGGNNGLKYRVRQYGRHWLGCEYQILGETKPSFSRGSCGSLYDLYEPNQEKQLQPPGEWNQGKIVAQGGRIEHWLNGRKVVEADLGSPQWRERLEKSKFAEHDDFARNTTGRLMLTEHGSPVWYRNLELTLLPPQAVPPIAPDPADLLYAVGPLEPEAAKKYHLDPEFYKKCVMVQNILIATSDRVSDFALREAAYQFDQVMQNIQPEVAQRIRDQEVLCVLIAHNELTSQLPQFKTDKTGEELDYYNWRSRGFLTRQHGRPTVVFAEEDVLEYDGGMQKESILIHEFGHVIDGAGFDQALRERLTKAYEHAKEQGLWNDGRAAQRFRLVTSTEPVSLLDALAASFPHQDREMLSRYLDGGDILVNGKPTTSDATVTKDDQVLIVFGGPKNCYASKNRAEYWAEGVQCWYDTNRTMDHDHNHIHTRDQLKKYDPVLAELCQEVLGDSQWRFVSPHKRAGRGHLKRFQPNKAPKVELAPHLMEAANDYYDDYWRKYWERLEKKYATQEVENAPTGEPPVEAVEPTN